MNLDMYRKDFPVLQSWINGKPIVYLDSACVTLKPVQVIDAMDDYYLNYPGCGGRSVHRLSTHVATACEDAREMVKRFINASSEREIIFTRNTTEGMNLVARGFGLKKGDIVLTTDKEHNSNLVPWHEMMKISGTRHLFVKSNPDNTFNVEEYKKALTRKVKLVSVYHTSNLDGYTLPAKEIISIAHDRGVKVLLDAAQSVPRIKVDVKSLDVDYLAFSFHKVCGPSGMGVLYGKLDLLEELKSFTVGGESVTDTTLESSTLLGPPQKFEGGLQNYAGIIGAGAAVQYMTKIGLDKIEEHERKLNNRLTRALCGIEEISIIGPRDPALRGGIYSFNIRTVQPHDAAMILDEAANIMVRSGMLCVHSWFNAHKIKGCIRASFYFYNTEAEVDLLASQIKKLVKDFCK